MQNAWWWNSENFENIQVQTGQEKTGKLQLEGCLGEDYYKVRDFLYEQYAVV